MESLLFLIRKIGRASTNPINKAINNGYCTLNPENSKIYNPIKETIKDLSEREKRILSLRFMQGKTQMEVSKEIGISQAQVSRLEKNVINRIKGK